MMPITPRTIFHMSSCRHLQVGKRFQHMEADLHHRSDRRKRNAPAAGLPQDEVPEPPAEDSVVLATFWSWPSLLLVRLSPNIVRPDFADSLMVVAPDPRGLHQLEVLDAEIESMWLIQPPLSGGGQIRTEEIRKVGPWPTTATAKEPLTGFHCVSGAIFVLRQGHMYRIEERSLHWSSGGKFRLNGRPGEP